MALGVTDKSGEKKVGILATIEILPTDIRRAAVLAGMQRTMAWQLGGRRYTGVSRLRVQLVGSMLFGLGTLVDMVWARGTASA